ncbi:MAG: ATP-binding cassette domain-containing protein [Christensenellales bacterium]
MIIFNYCLMLLFIAGILAIYALIRLKKINGKIDTLLIVLSSILIVVFIFRYMLGEDAIQRTLALTNDVFDSKVINALAIIFNWLIYSALIFTCMYPFFKKAISRLNIIVRYFVLPVAIIYVFSYVMLSKSIVGVTAFDGFNIRVSLMALEASIMLIIGIIAFIDNGRFKVAKKDLLVLLYIIPMFLFALPSYALQGLFGYANLSVKIKSFTQPHRILLYLSILIPIAIYMVLRKKDKEIIRFSLLYISLVTLVSYLYTHRFASFTTVSGLPIHLCNTAMYIVPLCIIFKWKKLFYFTYFINVLGAFLAMAMPNYSDTINILSSGCVKFYINHYIAFFMPVLLVALEVFKRPKLKQFTWSMIAFAGYFAFVLICNAWFSNYDPSVDYFFVNSDFIAEKLGKWAENLRNTQWVFNIGSLKFVFYPIYQSLFFIVYVLLGLGMWFIYEQGYAFVDTLKDIASRNEKIKVDRLALEVAKAENKENMTMDKEREVSIKLINFSKRYGSSKVYAVKDANLEIKGGEVFGFLGHNGAGKSTIIKSIVGVQPITSGTIEVCGYDVDKEPVMAKKMIGFVPDHYALYEKLTGREYINYIADLWGVSLEDRNKSIEKYLDLFEMRNAFDNPIKTYSHGMKQKITIMSALVHNPKVWILDEPLTGLDPNSIYQVKECMKRHAKEGNIVFFSSHLIDVVETICDRVAIIKKGHILTVKTLKEIDETTGLEEFYLTTISKNIDAQKIEEKVKNAVEKEVKEKQKSTKIKKGIKNE